MKSNSTDKFTDVLPYKIKLSEVPEEGREYIFNQATGELSAELKDLIGSEAYEAKVFIKQLNTKDFLVQGHIKTATKEDCSLCGETFALKADLPVNEILIPQSTRHHEKTDKSEKQARSNHLSDMKEGGPGVIEYLNEEFEVGVCLRQLVALNIPFNPKPPVNKDGDCSVCLKSQIVGQFSYDENMGDEAKKNPFEVLKNIKLN